MDRKTTEEINYPWVGLAARVILGLIMAVSGTLKASSPVEEFAVVVESYNILPDAMIVTTAQFLPWLELFLGVALAAGYLTRQAAAGAGVMLLAFIFALFSTQLRGIHLPNCGCFGHGIHLSTAQALLFDSFLTGLAFLSYKKGAAKLSLDNWIHSGL